MNKIEKDMRYVIKRSGDKVVFKTDKIDIFVLPLGVLDPLET